MYQDSKRQNHKLSSSSFNHHNEDNLSRNRFGENNSQEPKSSRTSFQELQENLREKEFGWKQTETLNSIPPNDYKITHINQNHEILVRDLENLLSKIKIKKKLY